MKKHLTKTIMILMFTAAMLCSFLLTGCEAALRGKMYDTLEFFNTDITVGVYDDFTADGAEDKFKNCWAEIKRAVREIEQSISATVASSYISKFNEAGAGSEVELDETAYIVMNLAKECFTLTGGAFDPAAGLLADLWGFTPRFKSNYSPKKPYDRLDPQTKLPDEKYITAFFPLTGFDKVELLERGGGYYAVKPDAVATVTGADGKDYTYTMQIDLGGIGKGYAADVAEGIMRDYGYEFGYANFGGSSITLLAYPDGRKITDWTLPVKNPVSPENTYIELYVMDEPVSTSGGYQNYYEINGTAYSHIIDVSTGRPAAGGVLTATVTGTSAAEADAVTTALCAMSVEDAKQFIGAYSGKAAIVYKSGSGYAVATNMDKKSYKITDGNFFVT